MNMENTATPRQRWALFCITKKDYRNEILSKEEAARLIKELGNPNYTKKSNKSLTTELLDYLKEHSDRIFGAATASLKIKSVIQEDKPESENPKKYAFIGFGCGITYMKFRKNNKKANEINDAMRKFRFGEMEKMFLNQFTTKERKYYESIGCPLEAVWTQDINIQQSYYYTVQKFAEEHGIHMEVVSRLD